MYEFPNSFNVVYSSGRVSDALLVLTLQGEYVEVCLEGKSNYVDSLISVLMDLEFEEEYREIEMYIGGKFYSLTFQDRSALCAALIEYRFVHDFGGDLISGLH